MALQSLIPMQHGSNMTFGTNNRVIDGSGDFLAAQFIVPTGGATISDMECIVDVQNSPGSLDIVLQGNTAATGNPDGSDVGSTSITKNSGDFTDLTGITTFSFASSYAASAGEILWLVIKPNTGTFDGSNQYRFKGWSSTVFDFGDGGFAKTSTDSGSAWSNIDSLGVGLKTSGGDYITGPNQAFLVNANAYVDYDNGDNPDEYAGVIQVPTDVDYKIHGVEIGLRQQTTVADMNLFVYSGSLATPGTALVDQAIDISAISVSGSGSSGDAAWRELRGFPVTASAGDLLIIGLKATDTGNLRIPANSFGTAARREAWTPGSWNYMAQRDGGSGAYTAKDSEAWFFGGVWPLIEPISAASGGGGGPVPSMVSVPAPNYGSF